MYEILLVIWIGGVLVFAYLVAKHLRLIGTNPFNRALEDRKIMDQASTLISGAVCPFCRGSVKILNIDYKVWGAETKCKRCGQLSLWLFVADHWILKAPLRYLPDPVLRIESKIDNSKRFNLAQIEKSLPKEIVDCEVTSDVQPKTDGGHIE